MNVSPSSTPAPNSRRTRQKSRQGGRAGRAELLGRGSGAEAGADTSTAAERARPGVTSPIAMREAYASARRSGGLRSQSPYGVEQSVDPKRLVQKGGGSRRFVLRDGRQDHHRDLREHGIVFNDRENLPTGHEGHH